MSLYDPFEHIRRLKFTRECLRITVLIQLGVIAALVIHILQGE